MRTWSKSWVLTYPLAVQIQAFPELAGLFKMERKAAQDWKDWAEAMALKAERDREREIERVRNELIILNRFYPAGGIVAAHPARVLCQNLSLVSSVVGRHLGCPRCTVIGTQCV